MILIHHQRFDVETVMDSAENMPCSNNLKRNAPPRPMQNQNQYSMRSSYSMHTNNPIMPTSIATSQPALHCFQQQPPLPPAWDVSARMPHPRESSIPCNNPHKGFHQAPKLGLEGSRMPQPNNTCDQFQELPFFPAAKNGQSQGINTIPPPNCNIPPPNFAIPPPNNIHLQPISGLQFCNSPVTFLPQLQQFQQLRSPSSWPNFGGNFESHERSKYYTNKSSEVSSKEKFCNETDNGSVRKDGWVGKWEADKLSKYRKSENQVKIHDMKAVISKYCHQLQVLRRYNQYIKENVTLLGGDEWEQLYAQINNLKEELSESATIEMADDRLQATALLLRRRKSKRKYRQHKKAKKAATKVREQEYRQKREQEIDEWRSKVLAETQFKLMVESMKNEAGDTLIQVKKKNTEMRKMKEFVDSLDALREIRRETSLKRGVFVLPEQDQRLFDRVKEAKLIISNQLKTYGEEEKALRVMMEEEKEGIERQEREKQRVAREMKQSGHDNLVNSCRLYWQQADDSIESLIHIRGSWDAFINPLVPGSSPLPYSWVTPCMPTSNAWKKYLKNISSSKSSPSNTDDTSHS